MWTPGPFDLAATGYAPLASFAAIPVTLTLGPLAAYNVLVLISPVLAAFLTFRLCHYVTGRLAPSLVGGFLFGFSSYLVGQMMGHLHLTLVFFVPLGVHLGLRYMDEQIGRRRFVISIAAVIAGQALLSTEILFTALLFGAIALLAGAVFGDAADREHIRRLTSSLVFGGIVAAIVLAPFLYYALIYDTPPPLVAQSRISMDVLNPLVPTPVTRIGRSEFAAVSGTFVGGYSEAGGYVGIAIALLAGWWLISTWKRRASRVLLAVAGCTIVASLGTTLYISGQPTISLPWKALAHLPLFEQVIPVRLAMFTSLVIAIAVSQALAAPISRPAAVLRWGLALIGVVMLLPSGGSILFHSTPPDPTFFTSDQYKRYIDRDENVLALPYSARGFSLLWQARTDMWFRLAGGYLGQQPPDEYLEEPVVIQLFGGEANAETPCLLKSFIERRRVGSVVMEAASTEPYRPVLAELGLHSREVGGVDYYRVPKTLASPAGCT